MYSHHGLTESRFLVKTRATNGLGTITGLVQKVLKGFKNISRRPWEILAVKGTNQPGGGLVPWRPPIPPKKLNLPKSYMDYHFCYQKFFVRPTLLTGPLVKSSDIKTDSVLQPLEGRVKSKCVSNKSCSPYRVLIMIFQSPPGSSGSGYPDFRIFRKSRFLDSDWSLGF